MPHLDFLIAAKLIHLVPDVIFKALDVLLICAAVDEVEGSCSQSATLIIEEFKIIAVR